MIYQCRADSSLLLDDTVISATYSNSPWATYLSSSYNFWSRRLRQKIRVGKVSFMMIKYKLSVVLCCHFCLIESCLKINQIWWFRCASNKEIFILPLYCNDFLIIMCAIVLRYNTSILLHVLIHIIITFVNYKLYKSFVSR